MEKNLQRDESRKIVAGVAAGLSDYLDVDVVWIRAAFVLMVLLGFSGVLVYLILWIVVPSRPYYGIPGQNIPRDMAEGGDYAFRKKNDRPRTIVGAVLIVFGIYFLANEFFSIPLWLTMQKIWPVFFILVGLLIIFSSNWRKKKDVSDAPADEKGDDVNDIKDL